MAWQERDSEVSSGALHTCAQDAGFHLEAPHKTLETLGGRVTWSLYLRKVILEQ